MDSRLEALQVWASTALDLDPARYPLVPASDDASFRRYFRLEGAPPGWIVMDAPPDKENSDPFVSVAGQLSAGGIRVPEIKAWDRERGFMLLSDFGRALMLPALADASVRATLYRQAIDQLIVLQAVPADTLATYDGHLLNTEMALFPDWFLAKQLRRPANAGEQQMLAQLFESLTASALEQPQVFVHRDYHSRNLMLVDAEAPGVIDFQDAVCGPLSYDLVSLLRDCYFELDASLLSELLAYYAERAAVPGEISHAQLRRWFDLMGMQRHLKCAGIFARLNLRDGKPGYLADIPLVLRYLWQVAAAYAEFSEFAGWLEGDIMPLFERSQSS